VGADALAFRMTSREWIASAPAGTLIPIEAVRAALAEAGEPDVVTWLRLPSAAVIMGVPDRKLRRACVRWERMGRLAGKPPVRVARTSDADRAGWLLAEDDCWAWARQHNRPKAEPETDDADEDEADRAAAAIFRRQWG
jgi:hypothetical protein